MKPPSNHNPHAFYEDRSELASKAPSIAARLRGGPEAEAADRLAQSVTGIGPEREVRYVDGRTVLVLTRRPMLHDFY
jgi:hypothetical protein